MKDIKYYNNTDFAARMRLLMGARNVKLKDIADATSCSISAVSTWKRGRLPRSYKTISKLARVLRVSEEFLVNGQNGYVVFANESAFGGKAEENRGEFSERAAAREVGLIFDALSMRASETADGYARLRERLLSAFPETAGCAGSPVAAETAEI